MADRRADSRESASRWKSIEQTPLHVPGVPSSQPASKSPSAISSVSSQEPLRIKVNSYLVIAVRPSGSEPTAAHGGNGPPHAVNPWHGLRDFWELNTPPWHNRPGHRAGNTSVPKCAPAGPLSAASSLDPTPSQRLLGCACWGGWPLASFSAGAALPNQL